MCLLGTLPSPRARGLPFAPFTPFPSPERTARTGGMNCQGSLWCVPLPCSHPESGHQHRSSRAPCQVLSLISETLTMFHLVMGTGTHTQDLTDTRRITPSTNTRLSYVLALGCGMALSSQGHGDCLPGLIMGGHSRKPGSTQELS